MTDKSDLFDTPMPAAVQSRFERLLRKVPGLSSYIDENQRREADQMLRNAVAREMAASRLQLSNVHIALSKDVDKAMEYAGKLGRLYTRLVGLVGRIEAAPSGGYTGWFSGRHFDDDDLERIYAFDEQMFENADAIAIGVAALEKAVEIGKASDITTSLKELNKTVEQAQTTFRARIDLLSGFTADGGRNPR